MKVIKLILVAILAFVAVSLADPSTTSIDGRQYYEIGSSDEIRAQVNEGLLSMGHGRALLGLKNKRRIPEVAAKVIKEQLNVRQLEALVQQLNDDTVSRETRAEKKDVFVQATESQLREYFGTQVQIKKAKNKGKIEIEFYSEDDLQRILEILQLEEQ